MGETAVFRFWNGYSERDRSLIKSFRTDALFNKRRIAFDFKFDLFQWHSKGHPSAIRIFKFKATGMIRVFTLNRILKPVERVEFKLPKYKIFNKINYRSFTLLKHF